MLIPVIALFNGCVSKDTRPYSYQGMVVAKASAAADVPVEAYLSSFSVRQGQSIFLYANTDLPEFHLRIYQRRPVGNAIKAVYTNIPGVQQSIPAEPWNNCCDWTSPVEITIPEDWESGLYRIQLSTDTQYKYNYDMVLSFMVVEDVPGSTSQILVLDNAATNMAYNRWGGASAYPYPDVGVLQKPLLSLHRPGNNVFQWAEERFMLWAKYMGITMEYASMMDLESGPDFLYSYQTVVLVGHSEYWSRNQRDALDAFLAGGGNAVILAGNTMWWQVRYENGRMVIYKDPYADPLLGVNDELVSSYWHDWPVNDPENTTIGLSYRQGGNINDAEGKLPAIEGYGGYTVADQAHRLFAGTGLANGSEFGRLEKIAGFEVDGTEFNWVNGLPVTTGLNGTPASLEIIATSPATVGTWDGFGTMAVFDTGFGGSVFNAATIKWAFGLWDLQTKYIANPQVSKIMLNVFAETQPLSNAACSYAGGTNDYDGDGVVDACDNCIDVVNPVQSDVDGNGTGDLCELVAPVRLDIDIMPWNNTNIIDIDNEPTIAVALITQTRGSDGPLELDATQIDASTLRFGTGGAQVTGSPGTINIGGDSRTDMVVNFNTIETGLACGEVDLVMITGETVLGQEFEGMQKVTTEECSTGCH